MRFLSQVVSPGVDVKVIIFCAARRGCESLRSELRRRGFAAEALHGDKSQQERDWAMQQFRVGAASMLIATDVAGRGLDVKDVRYVVNYDAPSQAEDYVHRVGRAGRAGAEGTAFSLFTPANGVVAKEIITMLQASGIAVPPDLQDIARRFGGGDSQRRWR